MWKKKIACLMAAVALCGVMTAGAADYTILEKTEKVETTVYGTTQTGSLNDRIAALDTLLNGQNTVEGSIQNKTDALYRDVYGSSGSDLSLVAAVNLMQWQYAGQVTEEPLLVRVDSLEEGIDGKVTSGTLVGRVRSLRQALLGNAKYTSQEVTIPASTLVTVHTLEPLDSKTAQEGDTVQFAVTDDVMVGDVVAIPRGMEATGTITKARKSGRFGKDGKIEITYHSVRAADGTPVSLIIGEKAKEEYKRTAGAVGASAAGAIILGPVGLVGGLFVHGNDVEIPAGTDMMAETEANTEVMGFRRNEAPDDMKSANMAASGVQVPSHTGSTAEETGYHGSVTPVELGDTGDAGDSSADTAAHSDDDAQVVVTISPTEEQTGDVHE